MSLRAARSLCIPTAAAVVLLLAILSPASTAAELDRVAAVVNGDVILVSEVERRFRHLVFDLRQTSAGLPTQEALVSRSLDELILERLQLRIAEHLGLGITNDDIDRAVASIARRYDTTAAGLRRSLEAGGIPFTDFRERIRIDLLVERVRRQEVLNRIQVSEAEIGRYLAQPDQAPADEDEYLIGHILIPRSDDETAARARAEEVLQRSQAGEAFADLARRHSSGGRAAAGGLLGWRSATALPSLFADLVPRLRPGETSDIVESPGGYHIIKLIDTRQAGQSFVRQTRAAHILVITRPLVSDDEARLRLERLRERIQQGEDFDELARYHSDDSASAVRGGDLGWLSPDGTTPDFEAAMDRLQEGEVSEPFKSSWGWHILHVLERRNHDNTEEVRRSQARNAIFQRKAGEELTAWLRQLRDNAFVRIRLDE